MVTKPSFIIKHESPKCIDTLFTVQTNEQVAEMDKTSLHLILNDSHLTV